MTILNRLEQWKEDGTITEEQYRRFDALAREQPFSLFVELNVLLYAGVLAFVGGLGWTVSKWSQQLGDILVLTVLFSVCAGCFWYCFYRGPAWAPGETRSPSLVFDYVLYLGALTWSVALGYLEQRFHVLTGEWDLYLFLTAALFFFLAYRFDNRFVLSLALSSLAGWFGLSISHWQSHQDATYRLCALVYSLVVGAAGLMLERFQLKPHFQVTYLNISANVLFWAILSGVSNRQDNGVWTLALLAACGASLGWGLRRRQFSFVAYAAVYGYIGMSSLLLRELTGLTETLTYFVFTGCAMVVALVLIARRFGREA